MAVPWIEEQKISGFTMYSCFARRAFSAFNKADNVIVMKVVGKLHYAHEGISHLQFRSYFTLLVSLHFIFSLQKRPISLYMKSERSSRSYCRLLF